MSSVKILVSGDVKGNFRTLFSKIEDLEKKKGPFEALYCLGNFFGNNTEEYEELKSGKIKVPITTYILNGDQLSFKELYEPLENTVPKIVYLGKFGCLTGTTGLKIAYLSGVELPGNLRDNKSTVEDIKDKYNIHTSHHLVQSMIDHIGTGIDILLTSQWPKYVTNFGVSPDKDSESKINDASSIVVSFLAKHIKPRYHFAGMLDFYYERVPYRNHIDLIEKPVNVTRFFGLSHVKRGKLGNNEKWLYAFNIVPRCSLPAQDLVETSGPATVSPYANLTEVDGADRNFFFDDSVNNPRPSTSTKRGGGDNYGSQPKKLAIDGKTCWFCLSNPDVDKQLIITVGNHCYIAVSKGVLVPEHVFIVPIKHVSSSVKLSIEAFEEMEKFKVALAKYFHDKNEDVVFFERNYRSPHLHMQVIPTPKMMEDKINDELHSYADKFGLKSLPTSATIREVSPEESKDYFYFEHMVNMNLAAKYVVFIDNSGQDFPLQMGRNILASALDLTRRRIWQRCIDRNGEKEMAERMRQEFKKYNFTQE